MLALNSIIILVSFIFSLTSCSHEAPREHEGSSLEQQVSSLQSYTSVEPKPMDLSSALAILEDPNDKDPGELYAAIRTVGQEKNPEAVEPLLKVFQGNNDVAKILAAISLGQIRDARAVPTLLNAAKSQNTSLRFFAVQSLGQIQDPQARVLLEKIAQKDPVPRIREVAKVSLRNIREKEFIGGIQP